MDKTIVVKVKHLSRLKVWFNGDCTVLWFMFVVGFLLIRDIASVYLAVNICRIDAPVV